MVPSDPWHLTLYVSGTSPLTARVRSNLHEILEKHLDVGFEIETVDLEEEPGRAEDDMILALPTVIRRHPLPQRRILGDLADEEKVLTGLDISRES